MIVAPVADGIRSDVHRRVQPVLYVVARPGVGHLRSGRQRCQQSQVSEALLTGTPEFALQQGRVFQSRHARMSHLLYPFLYSLRYALHPSFVSYNFLLLFILLILIPV